jgi:hypothetical protein
MGQHGANQLADWPALAKERNRRFVFDGQSFVHKQSFLR